MPDESQQNLPSDAPEAQAADARFREEQSPPIVARRQHATMRYPLPWSLRIVSIVAGLVVLGMLITARVLEPDGSGMGTHQQLGLPPCTSVALFGMRCPGCGMTTSWSLFLRGQFVAAITANMGGVMLAIIGLVYVPWSCYFFFRGLTSRGEKFSFVLAMLLTSAMAVSMVQWIARWIATGHVQAY